MKQTLFFFIFEPVLAPVIMAVFPSSLFLLLHTLPAKYKKCSKAPITEFNIKIKFSKYYLSISTIYLRLLLIVLKNTF